MRRRQPPEFDGGPSVEPAAPTMLDLLSLPDDERGVMNRLLRHGPLSAADAADHLGAPPEAAEALLLRLESSGYVQREAADGEERFRARLQKRGRELPGALWDRLDL